MKLKRRDSKKKHDDRIWDVRFESTHIFRGIEFVATEKGILLHRRKHTSGVLKRFNMLGCYPTATPTDTSVKLTTKSE